MWENQKLIEMNTQMEVGELIAFFSPFVTINVQYSKFTLIFWRRTL